MLQIAPFLYEDMTALDAVGPYEVLARLPDAEIKFVLSTPGSTKTDVVIEYGPQPPYHSGSLEKADPDARQRGMERLTKGVGESVGR